jgi:hypothetical protein
MRIPSSQLIKVRYYCQHEGNLECRDLRYAEGLRAWAGQRLCIGCLVDRRQRGQSLEVR